MNNQHTNKHKEISEGSHSELHSLRACLVWAIKVFLFNDTNVGMSESLSLYVARRLIMIFTEPHQIALPSSGSPFPPWCHRAKLLLLMPTRSFCSETHQSARCLIGSERWESIAICTPAPKSSLWTCHSRRITCSCLVLHLTKGSPISTGRDNYTHNTPLLYHRPLPN